MSVCEEGRKEGRLFEESPEGPKERRQKDEDRRKMKENKGERATYHSSSLISGLWGTSCMFW